jgi:hypothetical protein
MSTVRTVGPVGPINEKTYLSQSLLSKGLAAKAGTVDGSSTAVTGAGQRALGIVSNDVTVIGNPAPIVRHGDTVGIAGAAIANDNYLKVNATGQLVPVAGGAGSGEEVVGRAQSTANALGDEICVFVNPFVL